MSDKKYSVKVRALSHLMDVGQELASSTDLDELLSKITRASQDLTDSDKASILLVDEDRQELYFRQTLGEYGEMLEKIRIPLNERSIAGWCVVHRKPVLIADVSNDPRHYKGVDKASGFVTKSILAVPIVWGERDFGVVEVLNKINGEYNDEDREYLTILAAQAAVALNNVYVVEQLQNFFVHTVELLIAALEQLDPSMRGHVIRVARMATALARELKLAGKDLEQVLYGAYFHDIGRLLNKSAASGTRKKTEPIVGAQLLQKIKLLEKVAPIVRYHRERFDGSGYPEGLRGTDIPLGARILGLAVEYDEEYLRSGHNMPPHVFREMFFQRASAHHDPQLLDLFKKVIFAHGDALVRTY
ncbi:MAG: GAF domain-containing protein [Armatimonadetes bacterium]|nr:GAF domain-containing protein [Armatimonadota bacterium]